MRPTPGELLILARTLAAVVHSDQYRRGTGAPYIGHVRRVAQRAPNGRAEIIAYLHDTIEDTAVTAYTLEQVGFPADIVRDVVALSRFPNETYLEFINRTASDGSDDALRVKLADLEDNLSDDWSGSTEGLRARYIKADAIIRAELKRRELAALRQGAVDQNVPA